MADDFGNELNRRSQSGPALGRPPADEEKRIAAKKQVRQDELDRIPVEGKLGQGKRRFSLSKIMCKLSATSETAIAVVFLVMNLEKWLQSIFFLPVFACSQSTMSAEKSKFRAPGSNECLKNCSKLRVVCMKLERLCCATAPW